MMLIIDGNNMAYRALYTHNLSNHGVDVSVTYGLFNILRALIKRFKPTSVIVCWDGGIPAYRREYCPTYKTSRSKDSSRDWEDVYRQMDECDSMLPVHGVLSVRLHGAEADDLMYQASLMAYSAVIVSTDNDMLLAVRDRVGVYNPHRDVMYNISNFEELVGVKPTNYLAYKALVGDSSDDVPGVKGIGPKTAIKLFEQYGNVHAIINAALAGTLALPRTKARAIAEFGYKGLLNNCVIMGLWQDRLGVRRKLLTSCDNWERASKAGIQQYYLANAFVSLLGELGIYTRLQQPTFRAEGLRVPAVLIAERTPV